MTRFVALHDVAESESASIAVPTFAVMIARSPQGAVLVFNLFRKVWELPGGLIDPGETARDAAERELVEESGCSANATTWLGLVQVADDVTYFGAVFACEVDTPAESFKSDEIGGVGVWRAENHPRPLGECDAALLNRFG